MKLKYEVIIVILFNSLFLFSQQNSSYQWESKIDSVINNYEIENGPGGVISVSKSNKILYAKAFGYSNVETKKNNTLNTLFSIQSCSKQFTAASVLKLSSEGKIDLNQSIQYYIPEIKIKKPIPVYSLLTHSSGINDFSEIMILGRGRDGVSDYSNEDRFSIIYNQTELGFNPLEADNYSNTNYALLADLVERVSKQKFPDYLKEHILEPLNMNRNEIQLGELYTSSKVDIATGYNRRGKGEVNFTPEKVGQINYQEKNIYGESGIKANIYGLVKWMSNYKLGKVDNENLLIDQLLHKDTLSNGKLTRNARGLVSGTTNSGVKWVQHTGRNLGGTSIMLWLPQFDISIICIVNTDEIWSQSITNAFFNDIVYSVENKNFLAKLNNSKTEKSKDKDNKKVEPSITPQPEVSISLDQLKKFVGYYPAGADVGGVIPPSGGVGVNKIILNEGKLQYIVYNGYTIDLKPISTTTLEAIGLNRPIQLRFINIDSKKSKIIIVDPSKSSEEIRYRVPELSLSEKKVLCGKYKSPNDTKSIPIEILLEEGKLYMQWGILKKRTQLHYLGDDILTSWKSGTYGMQCNLIIKRNSVGEITGFTYDGHRAWNLFFKKG